MFKNPVVLGVGGVSKVGKDTFADKLALISPVPILKFKFAHNLRQELDSCLGDYLDTSFFTEDPVLKESLRPIMVYAAELKRAKTKGLHFIQGAWSNMQSYTSKKLAFKGKDFDETGQKHFNFSPTVAKKHLPPIDAIFAVTDLRFADYDYDEVHFIKDNGYAIHLERYNFPPNNPVEERNNKKLRSLSHLQIDLPSLDREMEYNRNLENVISKILS